MISRKKKANNYLDSKYKVPLLIGLVCVYVIHLFFNAVLIPLQVNSVSMQPGIVQHSYLIYSPVGMPNSIIPFSRQIPRGAVVVLAPPYQQASSVGLNWLNTLYRLITLNIGDLNRLSRFGKTPYMVRRVIGIPGDTIYITGNMAQIQPGNTTKAADHFTSEFELVKTPYTILSDQQKTRDWPKTLPLLGNTQKVTLRKDEYFVLADNRNIGNDSSYWGPIAIKQIRGRVLFQYIKGKEPQPENLQTDK